LIITIVYLRMVAIESLCGRMVGNSIIVASTLIIVGKSAINARYF
jgi:hypothetical protein